METNGNGKPAAPVHLSVVLDRSGSMAPIADDIVGGFNEFLAEQRKQPGTAKVTFVQFDSEDPFEVLFDGVDLREVTDLERSAYRPRGSTPLYDAVGRMIGKIDADVAARTERDEQEEDQVVVIVTDGMENASREHTRGTVFDLIAERRTKGWVFAFLGANQEAYSDGDAMGVAAGNQAPWAVTPDGAKTMWKNVSHSASVHRAKTQPQRRASTDQFYEEDPDQAGK